MLSLAIVASLLTGCAQLEDIQETLEGLTEPLVIEAFLLGAVPPESDLIDLSDTAFADGTSLKVFLADATSIDDLEAGALDGATIELISDSLGALELVSETGGLYTANGNDGLEYYAGEDYTVNITNADAAHRVVVSAPHPVDIEVPAQHSAGERLLIDLTAYDYDAVLVAVLNVQTGELTYSNEPEGIQEMYDFTHTGSEVKRHEIPGVAFSGASVYAVGVAGMRNAGVDDYSDMNTGLSSFMVGQMRFYAVQAM
jgi:hypothetical protein